MSKVSTTARPDTRTLPPVECAPWCEDGSGHTDAGASGDQYCRLTGEDVELSREQYVEWDKGVWAREKLHTTVFRDLFEEPYLEIGTETHAFKFTPAEARQLVDRLSGLLDKLGA